METLAPPHLPDEHSAAHRRPATLDLLAAALLLGTVVLHVVAMFPSYFSATGSITSTGDQVTEYALLAAAWALALVIGLTGPHRTPVAAGLAVGLAVTELGFRVSDVGNAVRYGLSQAGPGMWLMTGAWIVGAAGAGVACLAAHSRHRTRPDPVEPEPVPSPVDWAAPEAWSPVEPDPSGGQEEDRTEVLPSPDPTRTGETPAGIVSRHVVGVEDEDAHERWAWTVLVAVLAAATAGAFLPAWDRYTLSAPAVGRTLSTTAGNAFSGPWQQVFGTLLSGFALLAVPIVAMRIKHKAAAAAAVCGALLVLLSQLASAVATVGEPVSPGIFGLTRSEAQSIGVVLSLHLTAWFTLDALAAYALFAAVMVWATLRVQPAPGLYPHSGEAGRSDPLARNPVMPSSS